MNPQEKIQHLLRLLEIERKEDLKQYREKVLSKSLKERCEKGVSWYPAELKHLSIGLGEKLVIEVERTVANTPHSLQTGAMVAVFGILSDQEVGRVHGVITKLHRQKMRIALGIELIPEWLHHAKLGIDLDFDDKTYKEMKHVLHQVEKPKDNRRLGELRDVLFGKVKPVYRKWEVIYKNPWLNASQNRAIQLALESQDVALIHGPPGTGKTTTLVAAIEEISHHEHQILVCAPSNTAVDLLTEKCHEKGLSVLRIGNPARVDETLHKLTLDGSIQQHPDYTILKKLRRDAEKIRTQALKFKRKFGGAERQERNNRMKEAREIKKMAHQLEDYIIHSILNNAQVICATLTGAANTVLGKKQFHTVCIDEAAQALTPACWIPISRAKRVILAGDHWQLPPTVKAVEAEKGGLSKTLFEEIMEMEGTSVMLEKQYRMHEYIMRFSARRFYQNKLYADVSVKDQQLGLNFPAVEYIDTAGCGCEEQKNEETLSTSNPEEAQLMLRHLAILINQLAAEEPDTFEGDFSIGVIAPYKAQVRYLRESLNESPMLSDYAAWISINTVDGFQGQERDVIYISLVRSNQKGEIGFLGDIRRMNVALTRARKKLVVVGDSATLGNHPFYQAFIEYAEEIGAYRSAWELMEV